MPLDIELLKKNLPARLQNSSRWVLWRLEDFEDRKRCKILKQVKSPTRNAKSNDPDTWASFEEAITSPLPPSHPSYKDEDNHRGVGLVFGAPFVGVDLDKCYDPQSGQIEPWATEFLGKVPPTYIEVTPSRTGFHLWYCCADHAKLPDGIRAEKAEVYARGRYFTMTGMKPTTAKDDLTELTLVQAKEIYALVEALKKKPTPVVRSQSQSPKLEQLMTTIDFPDLSAAVQSLLTALCYLYPNDLEYVEKKFKESKLYQETHWKEKWDRLGKPSMEKALAFVQANPRKARSQKNDEDPGVSSLVVIRGSQAKREHLKFLWEPYLPIGKLVHFGGNSSQGKSPVTVDLLARLTKGMSWPDGKPATAPRSVILMNVEDALEDTILPRFDLAGGDPERLYYVKGTKFEKEEFTHETMLALDRDIRLVAELARTTPELGLIVIDPITNYLGSAKMNAEEEVRAILSPLAALAAEINITVLTVGHFNRREKGTDPLHRMMGAAAFAGVARSVYAFGPDPESESPYAHIISPARGALGDESLKYHTEMEERTWDGETSKVVKVIWDGTTKATAEDAVDPTSRKDKGATTEAGDCLREFLRDGKKTALECQSHLQNAGFDWQKLNSINIRRKAGASAKQEKRQWYWFLATADRDPVSEDQLSAF